MKSLVIYYSLEGNTKLIADTIKNELNSDVLELRTKKQYPNKGFKKYLWGGKSVILKEKPKLLNKYIDISNIFIYMQSIANFLEGCDSIFVEVEEFEAECREEMNNYYEYYY